MFRFKGLGGLTGHLGRSTAVCALVAAVGCQGAAGEVPKDIGVAECDDYIGRYQACIASMKPEARRQPTDALRAQHDALFQSAHSAAGSGGLKQACQRLLDGLTSGLGCR